MSSFTKAFCVAIVQQVIKFKVCPPPTSRRRFGSCVDLPEARQEGFFGVAGISEVLGLYWQPCVGPARLFLLAAGGWGLVFVAKGLLR